MRGIKENDDLVKDYGMDSLDAMDLIVAFENEYNISISESDIRKISIDTVKDLVDYIQTVVVKKRKYYSTSPGAESPPGAPGGA